MTDHSDCPLTRLKGLDPIILLVPAIKGAIRNTIQYN